MEVRLWIWNSSHEEAYNRIQRLVIVTIYLIALVHQDRSKIGCATVTLSTRLQRLHPISGPVSQRTFHPRSSLFFPLHSPSSLDMSGGTFSLIDSARISDPMVYIRDGCVFSRVVNRRSRNLTHSKDRSLVLLYRLVFFALFDLVYCLFYRHCRQSHQQAWRSEH